MNTILKTKGSPEHTVTLTHLDEYDRPMLSIEDTRFPMKAMIVQEAIVNGIDWTLTLSFQGFKSTTIGDPVNIYLSIAGYRQIANSINLLINPATYLDGVENFRKAVADIYTLANQGKTFEGTPEQVSEVVKHLESSRINPYQAYINTGNCEAIHAVYDLVTMNIVPPSTKTEPEASRVKLANIIDHLTKRLGALISQPYPVSSPPEYTLYGIRDRSPDGYGRFEPQFVPPGDGPWLRYPQPVPGYSPEQGIYYQNTHPGFNNTQAGTSTPHNPKWRDSCTAGWPKDALNPNPSEPTVTPVNKEGVGQTSQTTDKSPEPDAKWKEWSLDEVLIAGSQAVSVQAIHSESQMKTNLMKDDTP